jgi:hypothetical protein
VFALVEVRFRLDQGMVTALLSRVFVAPIACVIMSDMSSFDKTFDEHEAERQQQRDRAHAIQDRSRERLDKLVESCEASFKSALEKLGLANVAVHHSEFDTLPSGVRTTMTASARDEKLDFQMTVRLDWADGDGTNVGLGNVGNLSGTVALRDDSSRQHSFGGPFMGPIVNPVCGIDVNTLKMMIDSAIPKL